LAAASGAAAECEAATAATIGAAEGIFIPPGTATPPSWTGSLEGSSLSSDLAKAQTPVTVTKVEEVTCWAVPSGLYLLLAPRAPERTPVVR